MNTVYKVIGQYMEADKVLAYHLVSNKGEEMQTPREQTIYMIQRGLVENMRIQTTKDGEVIIRGRGVNLNSLPVYNLNKHFKRLKITRRILFKGKCVGYEIEDDKGHKMNLGNKKIKELAVQGKLSNASLKKYTNTTGEVLLVLTGDGCRLHELPSVILTGTGKQEEQEEQDIVYKAIMMKRTGNIYSLNNTNKKIMFKPGDYVLLDTHGNISTKSQEEIVRGYINIKDSTKDCLTEKSNLSYILEIYGYNPIKLTDRHLESWEMLKAKV